MPHLCDSERGRRCSKPSDEVSVSSGVGRWRYYPHPGPQYTSGPPPSQPPRQPVTSPPCLLDLSHRRHHHRLRRAAIAAPSVPTTITTIATTVTTAAGPPSPPTSSGELRGICRDLGPAPLVGDLRCIRRTHPDARVHALRPRVASPRSGTPRRQGVCLCKCRRRHSHRHHSFTHHWHLHHYHHQGQTASI